MSFLGGYASELLGHKNSRTISFREKDNRPGIQKYTGLELLEKDVKEIPTLVSPVLPRAGLAALVGSSDVGKSSLARHACLSVVNNTEYFIGFKMNPLHKRALYISTEDDAEAIAFLIKRQVDGLNHGYDQYENITFLFECSDHLIKSLDRELSKKPVDLVVIDTFSDLFRGQLNQANAVRSFLNDFSRLVNKHNCLILFLHHTGKKTELLEPSKNNVVGSQGFESKMRLVMELRQDWYSAELRHLCIVKGNYLQKEYKNRSFVLRMDENMLFFHPGDRVPFEELKKPENGHGNALNNSPEKVDEVLRLHKEGNSYRKIENLTGVSKTTVGNIINKYIGEQSTMKF